MFIVSKEHNDVYNQSSITNIYIGSDGTSIKVSAGSTTRGGILGKYNSYEEAKKALEIILECIAKNNMEVIYMPQDKEVKDKMQAKEAYHHITGKKTKGHGGS